LIDFLLPQKACYSSALQMEKNNNSHPIEMQLKKGVTVQQHPICRQNLTHAG
jgi:hypothetical protein